MSTWIDKARGAGSTVRSKARRHLPFTHGAKAVLEGSLRVAIRRGDRHIRAEHILLSLLAVPSEDPTARVSLSWGWTRSRFEPASRPRWLRGWPDLEIPLLILARR